MEEFEVTFKAFVPALLYTDHCSDWRRLGKIVYDVGLALARACEPFGSYFLGRISPSLRFSLVLAASPNRSKSLESLIAQSQCNKVRSQMKMSQLALRWIGALIALLS